ncbi:MAG: ComEC/Rec2 family competence protein [Tessaracoccus sp.]|uniref:ComEC/Rec2 family competence protein n=1 Tax=Tessaracoccus sp. TaxID=1971211 RepID=UPI001EB5D3E2|nr:ComEC/Rec2 family competence protein [Tessaracoccus sp.]MBK7820591.1 ComEC/Rec2 family competence protein [Tessaracoccus sp.]
MLARHDLRLVPLAVACWGGAFIGVSGWRPEPGALFSLTVGVGLLGVLALRARRPWLAICVAALLLATLAAGARSWVLHESPVAALAADRASGVVEFRPRAEPHPSGDVVVVRGEMLSYEGRGRRIESRVPVVMIGVGAQGEAALRLIPGARYQARVRLGATEPGDAAAALLSLRQDPVRLDDPGPLDALANGLRSGLRAAVAHSPPEQAALVPSLVVGDTSAVSEEMGEAFRATGLTHLMAVSGANLTLMLVVLLAAVRGAGLRGWWVRGAAVVGVGGFVLVCGQDPSVLRAAAMGLVALAATGASRGSRSVRGLAVAVCVLMWIDPWLASSAGFALSVAACAGIVLLAPRLIAAMVHWCPRWAAEALAVALAAQLATQPIVTAISGQVSVVGVLTNVLAAPFVGPTTILGLAAALLSFWPVLAAGPGWAAGWCAQPILWLAHAGASLPAAAWSWSATPIGVLLVGVGSGALAALLVVALRSPWGGAGFVAILVAMCLVRPVPLGWPGEWTAAFCDVGQGDATAIRAGPRAAVLIDAAPDGRDVVACLDSLGVREVPLLILTHYHADHVGGADDILSRYRPRLVLVRAGAPPAWLTEAAIQTGAQLHTPVPGETITAGEATWRTVSVGEAGALAEGVDEGRDGLGDGEAENDASIVGVAESAGLRVLLAGDAEPVGQARALRSAALLGLDLRADVLKLPHHGSARQEPRFFAASGASLAVASSGADNDYGHPAKSALDLATTHGMAIARTDTQGTILVARRDEALRVTTRKEQ